ncbi:hypothetical protein Tsubulata_043613 [Turnera subulata]|uniref:Uncharacterized protein n=1 Tax=Turnera subulata TaxID=218843 RepID=A0A9Q0J1W0_9ROSI|nr:hypothetical protein Tsubulata_043613 [Turnera subulata]
MLCSRPSIKDVAGPGISMSLSSDPLSPKISCMGQVKRNNKIVGLPTSSSSSSSNKLTANLSTTASLRYSKLKKMFSPRNLSAATPPSSTKAASTTTSTCRRRDFASNGGTRHKNNIDESSNVQRKIDESKVASVLISIDEMDPPLPVIKKVHKPASGEEEQDSLWKRRSGGVTIRNLQLQQIQLNRHVLPPTNHHLMLSNSGRQGREEGNIIIN